MIRPWFRQAAVPWKTMATQTRASGENRVSTKPGVFQVAASGDHPGQCRGDDQGEQQRGDQRREDLARGGRQIGSRPARVRQPI